MQNPIQVTFRHVPQSDAVDAYVRDRASKLDTFFDRITGCHVAVEAPHLHKQHGRHYRVRIDLTVPGDEIVVNRAPDEGASNEDVYATIDAAFDEAGRRLEDHARRRRGDVKTHEPAYTKGRVKKLYGYEGYGFLEAADGTEVYFHKNSVLHHAFDRLTIGGWVHYVAEDGDKGPQASTVVPLRD